MSALASRGNDLRPDRTTELASLVQAEADRVDQLGRTASGLRAEVDALSARGQGAGLPDLGAAAERADSVAVTGPAVTVVLTDAPAWLGARLIGPPDHAGWGLLVRAQIEQVHIGDDPADGLLSLVRGRYRALPGGDGPGR